MSRITNQVQYRAALRDLHRLTAMKLAEKWWLDTGHQLPASDEEFEREAAEVVDRLASNVEATHRANGVPLSFDAPMILHAGEAFMERADELRRTALPHANDDGEKAN